MRIVVIARTRNEEKNMDRFCRCYSWVDKIIIADGGSIDRTKQVAQRFPNVEVHDFPHIISQDGGETWRNPHGLHINFMIDKAVADGADWIIFDDIDCLPNKHMQYEMRQVLSGLTDQNCIFLHRIYMYGHREYLKDATLPGKPREFGNPKNMSLYAWKPGVVRASIEDPWVHDMILKDANIFYLSPPMAVMHDFYPEDGSRLEKVEFYDKSGEQPGCNDPLKVYHQIEPLEGWMKWE